MWLLKPDFTLRVAYLWAATCFLHVKGVVFISENNLLHCRAGFGTLTCVEARAALCIHVFIYLSVGLLHRSFFVNVRVRSVGVFPCDLHTFAQVNPAVAERALLAWVAAKLSTGTPFCWHNPRICYPRSLYPALRQSFSWTVNVFAFKVELDTLK